MQIFQQANVKKPYLRVHLKGGEVSLSFPVGATLGDVAAWVEGIMRLQDSAPIAIDITMATATHFSPYSNGTSHATH